MVATALAAGLLVPAAARAVPIAGQLSIVGSLVLGADTVDFAPAGGGSGTFVVALPSTGSFAGLVGTTGTFADLDVSPGQVGTPISVAAVLALAVLPTPAFELTFLHPGAFSAADCGAAPAPGQVCTPSGSALQLANVPTGLGIGSVLSFSLSGIVTEGTDVSNFTGVVTAQFAQPYQSVLAALAAGGTVPAAYSAVFEVVPIPEASTLLLSGLGLALLAAGRSRSR